MEKEKIDFIKIGMDIINDRDTGNGAMPEIKSIKTLLSYFYEINVVEDKRRTIIGKKLFILNGLATEKDAKKYDYINNYDGQVFFIHCDYDLILKKYIHKTNIEITREDIIYLTQVKEHNIQRLIAKLTEEDSNEIVKRVLCFEFEKIPLLNTKEIQISYEHNNKLIYYGGLRKGKRKNKIIQFYLNVPDTEIYGNIDGGDFGEVINKIKLPPLFKPRLPHREILLKLNESLAHVIIGDEELNQHFTQRVYECILSNIVTFIDIEYDTSKTIYSCLSEDVKEFLYVSNKNDVKKRMKQLRKDNDFRIRVLEEQQKIIRDFDMKTYFDTFDKITKAHKEGNKNENTGNKRR